MSARFAALAFGLLLGSVDPAQAADPDLRWRTLSTEHFRVHYHDDGGAFARRAAAIAEDAYYTLTTALGWAPLDDVIHVVCHDLSDGANGFAGVLPYSVITIQAFSPEADTDLAHYDDWLRLLVVHELTHILHLEQVGSIPRGINTVLGKTLLPNLALPRWMTEGIATWVESRFTGAGRVGSANFEMYLRAAVLGGTLPRTLGGFTGDPIDWPGAIWSYAFGGTFVAWLADRHGAGAISEFVTRYGRRVIPYGINNVGRSVFGQDLSSLFRVWRAELEARVRAQAARIRSQGLLVGRQLTTAGQVHHGPQFGPDHRLTVAHSDGYSPTRRFVGRVDDRGLTLEPVHECYGGCGRAVFSRDGSRLYAISGRWYGPHRFYRDVVEVDLTHPNPTPKRLTRGLRAREPDLDPTGRRLVFVSARWGRTALMEVDVTTGLVATLIPFDAGWLLAQPRWLSNGDLLVSAQRDGGWRDLWRRRADGTMERLTSDPAREIGLSRPVDDRVLYFGSDEGGIWNVHALDLESGLRWPVTRVLGGAFDPTVSRDGRTLVYTGYHANGRDLYALDLASLPRRVRPALGEPEPPRWQEPTLADAEVTDREYQPWRSAWPRRWSISTRADNTGFGGFGIAVDGNDAVGNHHWNVTVDYETAAQDVSVGAGYSYSGVRPFLDAFVARWSSTGFRYVADQWSEFHRENLFASVGAFFVLPDVEHPFTFRLGTSWRDTFEPGPEPKLVHDPGSGEPFVPRDESVVAFDFSWGYDHVKGYRYSISPEDGWRTGTNFSWVPAWKGSGTDAWSLTGHLDAYVGLPWLRAHVLALKYQGGVSGGAAPRRFSLGGFPEQSLVQDLLDETGLFGSYLRGFEPGVLQGQVFHQLVAEYRFPLAEFFAAPGTVPLWIRRLNGAVFSDLGLAWSDTLATDDFAASVGAELSLGVTLFYEVPITLRLGYAHAVAGPEAQQLYFVMGSNL